MRKKMAAAVLMAAMTASLLAGCGDSKSSDSTKADSAQTTASNQSEEGDSTSEGWKNRRTSDGMARI